MPHAGIRSLIYRIRYFTDGAAPGSASFIEKVFKTIRANFGRDRQKGSRQMRGAEWGELRIIRDLRKAVISMPS